MNIVKGKQATPLKCVMYGPEGIGKTTFASRWPAPLFLDFEGGTGRMNVDRIAVSGYSELEQIMGKLAKDHASYKTLVFDTADWLDRLMIRNVCDAANKKGIEEFGYGKGFTFLAEKWAAFLDRLNRFGEATGMHLVFLAHATLRKFEQPEEAGAYDRWELKCSKTVSPLLKEWTDLLLFANYKTIVVTDNGGKGKAAGGKRVVYTTHHPCWDAKNRFGLPEELPLDYASIAACIPGSSAPKAPSQRELAPQVTEGVPAPSAEADILPTPQAQPEPPREEVPKALLTPDLVALGVPEKLAPLMSANNVTPEELQHVVGERGYFPEDMPIKDYPMDFVEGCLIAAWPQVLQMVLDSRDLPF